MNSESMNEIKKVFSFADYEMKDLSYTMEPGMPYWPTHPCFQMEVMDNYDSGFYFNKIVFGEHNGTHIDAPAHFVPGGVTLDNLELKQLFGRALIMDIFTDYKEDFLLSVEQVKDWESKHCAVEKGDMVFVRFGMDLKYGIAPNDKAFNENWGGVSKEAAEYLKDKGISVIGTDTLCIDAYDRSTGDTSPAHAVFLRNGIYVIENLKGLAELPPVVGAAALPLKFKGGSGSPVRVIAFVPKEA